MDLMLQVIARAAIILVGLWVGVTVTAGTALLIHSYKRSRRFRYATVVMECPMCNGSGARSMEEVCPLCDGESALAERIPELDAG